MKTVDRTSQYYTRLLSKLDTQETQIEAFRVEIEKLEDERDSQRKEMEEYLLNTTIG